jgi:3-oxoadipate enol-lactonase
MENFSLGLAKPLFEIYPYKLMVDQSIAIIAVSQSSKDLLRASMNNLTKDEFIQIMMGTATCLHFEPGYAIGKPLLLLVGEKDWTGNIRKAMPAWAKVEPDCRYYVIPEAMHAANLDNPEFFHQKLLDFLKEVSN